MWILIGIAAVAAYLFNKWLTLDYDYFEKKEIAFSEPGIFKGIVAMTLKADSLPAMVQTWYQDFTDKKITGRFQFAKPIYIIRDPKLAKKIAIKDFDNFADHQAFFDENVDKMFGKSLFNMRGQKWRDMRATLSPMFTGSKMRMMYEFVADVGKQTAKTMKDQISAGSDNVFEFKDLATKFTVDVIATCAFGIEVNSFKDPDNEFAKIAKLVTDFTNWKTGLKFVGYLMMGPVMKALGVRIFAKEIDEFFQEAVINTMNVREEKGIVRNDVIHLLMQIRKGKLTHDAKDENITEGFSTVKESQVGKSQVKRVWDDDELAAQCFIFFLAGFDTIATTMSFMAHEITVNPEVQQKLYEEIAAMEAELNGKTISYEQIQGLKYMDQVVCEAMRKWPAAPMTDRVCVKDYDINVDGKTFTIEKDKVIMIPIFGFHRDPNYYPDPLKFDPERFSDENKHNIDPDTYLPFGIGPRNCIGSRFALMELKTIFYYLLKNFSLEVTPKTQIPLQFAKSPVGLKSEKGIWVGLKPRA